MSDTANAAPPAPIVNENAIKEVAAGRFSGGAHELGLAEHGVAFVADDHNRELLPLAIAQRARAIGDDIIAGRITVPWQ